MANDFEISIDIDAPPDVVWDLAGDPGASDIWIPAVSSVRVDGDIRYVTMVGGGTLRERLVDRDEQLRTFSYEVLDGVPNLLEQRGTIRVERSQPGHASTTGRPPSRRIRGTTSKLHRLPPPLETHTADVTLVVGCGGLFQSHRRSDRYRNLMRVEGGQFFPSDLARRRAVVSGHSIEDHVVGKTVGVWGEQERVHA